LNDAELIDAFCEGDFDAFSLLVERWQNRIRQVAYRYFNSYDDAMDITQKTFIRVYQEAGSLKDQRKFKPWIYTIVTNLCLDETKRAGRQRTTSMEAIKDKSAANTAADNVEILLHQKETGAILYEALQQIPDSQRMVVIMKEYENLTFKEISEVLDIPESTAKSRMYYGLSKLRHLFDRWNINKETLYYE
jgi:RNA polymerase sigma-70 factor (ECF subfamily)